MELENQTTSQGSNSAATSSQETSTDTNTQTGNETASQGQDVTTNQQTDSQGQENNTQTSSDGSQGNGEDNKQPETFLGTYKSKEEAEKGLQEKDSYIETLKQEKEALAQQQADFYKQMGVKDGSQFETMQKQAAIQQEYNSTLVIIDNDYNQKINELDYALQAKQINELEYQEYKDYWDSQRIEALTNVKANFQNANLNLQREQQTRAQQYQENYKKSMYEAHKEHKDLLDLYFDNAPTVEKAIAFKENIAKKAVADYIANEAAKGKLTTTTTTGGNNVVDGSGTFTRSQIANMSTAEFSKNEAAIMKAMQEGRIQG